jgi:hypothetical protein
MTPMMSAMRRDVFFVLRHFRHQRLFVAVQSAGAQARLVIGIGLLLGKNFRHLFSIAPSSPASVRTRVPAGPNPDIVELHVPLRDR